MCTVMSPDSSVRSVRTPWRASISMTGGEGCPWSLPSPTLTSANAGAHASSASSVSPFTLPWWGTLRTSTRSSIPAAPSRDSAVSSASPVSTALKPPRSSSVMTLVSLVESDGSGPGGQRVVSVVDPTRITSPATVVRTPPRGASRSIAPVQTANASSSATAGTITTPTRARPTRPDRPPVWSA